MQAGVPPARGSEEPHPLARRLTLLSIDSTEAHQDRNLSPSILALDFLRTPRSIHRTSSEPAWFAPPTTPSPREVERLLSSVPEDPLPLCISPAASSPPPMYEPGPNGPPFGPAQASPPNAHLNPAHTAIPPAWDALGWQPAPSPYTPRRASWTFETWHERVFGERPEDSVRVPPTPDPTQGHSIPLPAEVQSEGASRLSSIAPEALVDIREDKRRRNAEAARRSRARKRQQIETVVRHNEELQQRTRDLEATVLAQRQMILALQMKLRDARGEAGAHCELMSDDPTSMERTSGDLASHAGDRVHHQTHTSASNDHTDGTGAPGSSESFLPE